MTAQNTCTGRVLSLVDLLLHGTSQTPRYAETVTPTEKTYYLTAMLNRNNVHHWGLDNNICHTSSTENQNVSQRPCITLATRLWLLYNTLSHVELQVVFIFSKKLQMAFFCFVSPLEIHMES